MFGGPRHHRGYIWVVQNGSARTVWAAPHLTAHVVAHEVGHLVRFRYVTLAQLGDYWRLRGSPEVCKEELFAEDFRWLYGSEIAKAYRYRLTDEPPGEEAAAWMRTCFTEVR